MIERHLREVLDDPSCISFSENIDESPNRKKHFGAVVHSSSATEKSSRSQTGGGGGSHQI